MVERDNTIYAIAVKSGTSVFNADSRKKQEQNFMAASKLAQQAKNVLFLLLDMAMARRRLLIVVCLNSTWSWQEKISGLN